MQGVAYILSLRTPKNNLLASYIDGSPTRSCKPYFRWTTHLSGPRDLLCSRRYVRFIPLIAIMLLLLAFFRLGNWTLNPPSCLKAHIDNKTLGSDAGDTLASNISTDWSQYAYVQYATRKAYLCNSLMIFESLRRLGTHAELLLMYPRHWTPGDGTEVGRLLAQAHDLYEAKLLPITLQRHSPGATWADSFTKLLAFNQTRYKRILSLDSDATVLQVRLISRHAVAVRADMKYSQWTNYSSCPLLQSRCHELTG